MKTLQLVNGDLAIGPGGYATVSGASKVQQDLGVMVREAIGTDRFHPRWGTVLQDFVGEPITPETHLAIKAELQRLIQNYIVMQTRQIEADNALGRRPRFRPEEIVVNVDSIDIQQSFDRLNVRVIVRTAAGDDITIVRSAGF